MTVLRKHDQEQGSEDRKPVIGAAHDQDSANDRESEDQQEINTVINADLQKNGNPQN